MILNSKETEVIYRCPHCGASVISMVGIFTLNADMIKLKCDCGHSALTLEKMRGEKIKMKVPCLTCGGEHTFVISEKSFFDKKVLDVTCPYTGIEIAFIGGSDDCLKRLDESDRELEKMMEAAGIDSFDDFHNESGMTLTDPETDNLVRYMLEEFKADGCIHCKCPPGKGHYDFRFMNDDVLIFCTECNANAVIPLAGTLDAMSFIDSDEIILK